LRLEVVKHNPRIRGNSDTIYKREKVFVKIFLINHIPGEDPLHEDLFEGRRRWFGRGWSTLSCWGRRFHLCFIPVLLLGNGNKPLRSPLPQGISFPFRNWHTLVRCCPKVLVCLFVKYSYCNTAKGKDNKMRERGRRSRVTCAC
jgi:hypothetical protein